MKTICYLAGGYPSMEKSLQMAALYLKAGCDAIEWSLPPKDPYLDPEYIAKMMRTARAECDDYDVYLAKIAGFKKQHPQAEVFLLLYQETIREITPQRLLDFCRENGIDTIISADLTDVEIKKTLMDGGLKISAAVNYTLSPQELELALASNGFVYMQALPTPADVEAKRGRETLKKGIDKLRSIGIERPIYCGVGIRAPEDIAFIRESGGQGFFLGSTIMQYYDDTDKMMETIRAYKKAGE